MLFVHSPEEAQRAKRRDFLIHFILFYFYSHSSLYLEEMITNISNVESFLQILHCGLLNYCYRFNPLMPYFSFTRDVVILDRSPLAGL